MPLPPSLFCGPAGWSYPHWNGLVYPPARDRSFHALEYLSGFFDAVEINTSFYQHLRPELSRLWVAKVAANPRFQFTAKLHRNFTHERLLEAAAIARCKEGLWPLAQARRLGCLLLQFPWTFRYTEENRNFLIQLRRAFHEFPLVAEMRHASWAHPEALGMLIDYRVGFCNIDQAPYTSAMPPSAHLTSDIAYVRLHGRNPADWKLEFQPRHGAPNTAARHDYLYSAAELEEWRTRIDSLRPYAARTFVIANNDVAGQAVVNALELEALLGDERCVAPAALLLQYPRALAGFVPERPVQAALFDRAVA